MADKESTERAAMLAILVSRHSTLPANVVARHVCDLQRIARQAKRNAIAMCNYPDVTDRRDKLRLKTVSTMADLGPGFEIAIGGDPRGPCAWLSIQGEPGEGFSHDGKSYAIY